MQARQRTTTCQCLPVVCHLLHIHQSNFIFGSDFFLFFFLNQTAFFFNQWAAQNRYTVYNKKNYFKVLLKPSETFFLTSYTPPRSDEVFLLFAGRLVALLLLQILSWGQFPRRPVGSFVVAEVSVEEESENSQRQQDENNDH